MLEVVNEMQFIAQLLVVRAVYSPDRRLYFLIIV